MKGRFGIRPGRQDRSVPTDPGGDAVPGGPPACGASPTHPNWDLPNQLANKHTNKPTEPTYGPNRAAPRQRRLLFIRPVVNSVMYHNFHAARYSLRSEHTGGREHMQTVMA